MKRDILKLVIDIATVLPNSGYSQQVTLRAIEKLIGDAELNDLELAIIKRAVAFIRDQAQSSWEQPNVIEISELDYDSNTQSDLLSYAISSTHSSLRLASSAKPSIAPGRGQVLQFCTNTEADLRISNDHEIKAFLEKNKQLSVFDAEFDSSPYMCLRSFQETDARWFFGRDQETSAAIVMLQRQPVLAVIGPSEVGKSSFVRAGLLPALRNSEEWALMALRPGHHPMGALAQLVLSLNEHNTTNIVDTSLYHAILNQLYSEPGYARTILQSWSHKKGQKVLVFVDQFEELYQLALAPCERMAFMRCLFSIADNVNSPLRIVITLPLGYLDRVSENEYAVATLSRGPFFLKPPNRVKLRDALILPAMMAGYHFEAESTITHILDYLEHIPSSLALLQIVAAKLWDKRNTQRRLITQAAYNELRGIEGALVAYATSAMSKISTKYKSLVFTILGLTQNKCNL